MVGKIKEVSSILEPDYSLTSCVVDHITGEVFECFRSPQKLWDCMFMGYAVPDETGGDPEMAELPINEDGRSALYCRVLESADMDKVKSIHKRLPKRIRKPLKLGFWYRVIYD